MKKRKKQRMISVIAIVCMMLTMFNGMTITVNAVTATDVSNETELKAAITNASAGYTINITRDITISSEIYINNKSIIIEGNNHTITVLVTGLDDSGIYNVSPSPTRVFDVTALGKTVEIDNLNVKGGGKEGILNNVGTVLKLTNVNISNSNNPGGGGGIINSGGTVYLKDSNISRNAARYGGGFLNSNGSKMFIENSTFSENRSTSSGGGGGAGENQGELYANNSTFSNNKSTELGGAINNHGGTAYFVNSTFTGNVAYGSYSGGAIANNGGTVKTINSLFAYNYRNSSTQSTPSYKLNDIYVFSGNNIDSYYCIFQDANYGTYKSSNSVGNTQYTGAADGSNNSIFTNGVNAKVLGPDGQEIGTDTVFQPLLAKAGSSTTSALLKTASSVLGCGVKTSFTNGNGTPSIGYYDGSNWASLVGTANGSNEVTVDQNNAARDTPTVGSVVTTASDIYLLKVNAAAGGTVAGGTIYGDAYNSGTTIALTANPKEGYRFVRWDYVDGGTGIASISNPYSVTLTHNTTLRPVFSPPTLTPGVVNRTSNTEATVKFTSTDSGRYYYKIVEYGAEAPIIDTTEAGIACDGGETTITNPVGLTEGAKDIYIVVKDAEGNESIPIRITIANYIFLPIITQGEVNRTSNTEATVKFTSNKAGSYLYVIQNDEGGGPVAGPIACSAGEITIANPIGLAKGKNNIYIQLMDSEEYSSNVLNIEIPEYVPDTTAPADAAFEADVTTITNGNVEVTVNYPSDAVVKKYSIDGVNYNDYTDAITFSENGTLYAKSQDAAENWSNVSQYNVTNIDKTLPSLSVSGNPTDWTGNSITLTVNANDEVSGLAAAAYSFDGGATWQAGNTKTYDSNVDGIVVMVKDNAGNIAAYDTINITKIDKTAPSTAIIANNNNYTENKWFNESQTITASFTKTEGCDEKLQYKVDDSAWADGESADVNTEGKHAVSFRVIDTLGRTSEVQTVKVNIDKTAPTNAKITIKDKEFTSFLNTITFGLFFKETVGVAITADSNISGIDKIEYQKVSDTSAYNSEGTWISGSSFSVSPDEKFIVYARITDNAGNYIIINSDGVIVDATKPALTLTPDTNNWTKNNVNVKVTTADALAGLKEVTYTTDESVPQTGTVSIVNGEGTITLTNEGQYKLTVIAEDNSLNEISESINIKIDKTLPSLSVSGNPTTCTKDSVALIVDASDTASLLAEKAYSFDGGITWQESNEKIYDTNTDGIVVTVKDNAGNIAAYDTINITKIDKTAPNTVIIANNNNYTENKWFNESQTITASFTKTEGCDEKLQYKVDDSAWTDGASVDVNTEGKYTVNFRVIDDLDRTSEVQTVNVNIDKTAPTDAKITVKDKGFTSFLNAITFGLFFKETVGVAITADCNISGIDKIEYQKVSDASAYDPDGTWTEGDSFSVSPDEKFIVYAKITDNAGNYVIINSDGVIVDATKPALTLTPDTNDWTKNNVNVKVTTADALAGLKEVTYTTDESVPQTGTVSIVNGEGTITLTNEGQYKLIVTAKDNSLNEISESADIKIDKTIPIITGAGNSSSYFIGRVIKLTDDIGEIAEATYKNGTDTDTSFKDGDLFEKAGNYTLTLIDKAGNSNTLSFEIKVLPKVEDVVYTADCKILIDSIRDEFISHNDLPEPYRTDMDNEIKALEDRYSQLDKEVIEIKTETNTIKGEVEKLPNGVDGLLSLQKEIQEENNKIAGDASTLTEEEKKALENEEEYLKQQLNIIVTLQNQVDDIKTQVSNIDTKEDGLISQEGKITGILSDIGKLTKEQQSILKPQIDLLNSLLNKINTLKDQVETVKEMINSLPPLDKITKQDSDNINKSYKSYSELTNEQKELLGEDLSKQLNGTVEVLKKIMLYDAKTDLTVIGIDGTSFTPDVYLVVTPINEGTDEAKLKSASKGIEDASKYISELEGKELLALYDVSLFRDNIKIQPDGNVKVKIKIPEELRNRTGFDIVHIADNGTVTSMNAAVEGDYLVFTTNHFSEYAIVAKSIVKEIPKTGSVVDFNSLIIVGILLNLIGIVLIRKKIKRT